MATPRRPGRPVRAGGSAAARRRQQEMEEQEPLLDEDGNPIEEEPPPPKGPPVAMMVGVGAGLVFAVIVMILVFNRHEFAVELENTSLEPVQDVVVKVNGLQCNLGNFRPNEIKGDHVRCSPGNDVEIEYFAPNLGKRVKKLPKKSIDGQDTAPDFANFQGRIRIRFQADGIHETEY
jgi:hypothetical protein